MLNHGPLRIYSRVRDNMKGQAGAPDKPLYVYFCDGYVVNIVYKQGSGNCRCSGVWGIVMTDQVSLVVLLVISEGVSVLFYCAVWRLNKRAGTILVSHITYGALTGFLAFIITALLLSRYGINYLIQVAVVLAICFFMLNSGLMGGLVKNRK